MEVKKTMFSSVPDSYRAMKRRLFGDSCETQAEVMLAWALSGD